MSSVCIVRETAVRDSRRSQGIIGSDVNRTRIGFELYGGGNLSGNDGRWQETSACLALGSIE